MIDEETRQRAKEYADSFAEATADDPKPPAPDLEPMEPVKEAASAPVEDEDAKLFSEAFNAVEITPVVRGEVEVKPLADIKTTDKETFAQAWRRNRDAGNKTFEWAGKPGMKYSTENKEEALARKAEALARKAAQHVVTKPVSAKPVIVAKSVNQAKPTPQQIEGKAKPTIYGNTFVKDAVDSIKAKLNDDTQVGKAKFHANGRPNLTAR